MNMNPIADIDGQWIEAGKKKKCKRGLTRSQKTGRCRKYVPPGSKRSKSRKSSKKTSKTSKKTSKMSLKSARARAQSAVARRSRERAAQLRNQYMAEQMMQGDYFPVVD
jgi:hypothetical protein